LTRVQSATARPTMRPVGVDDGSPFRIITAEAAAFIRAALFASRSWAPKRAACSFKNEDYATEHLGTKARRI